MDVEHAADHNHTKVLLRSADFKVPRQNFKFDHTMIESHVGNLGRRPKKFLDGHQLKENNHL